MIGRGLDFEAAPPLAAPLRFFLTAPVFAVLAGGVLAWGGEDAFAARLAPVTLGLAHLLTLGFLTMVMCGASLQILPVLVGAPVPGALGVARAVHVLLTAGALALAGGLALGVPALVGAALPSLGLSVLVFVGAAGVALLRAPTPGPGLSTVRGAVAALAVAAGLGLALAARWVVPGGLAVPGALGAVHVAWALLGWVLLLVAAVAYRVVPMFQVTPDYPEVLRHWLWRACGAALVLWTLTLLGGRTPGLAVPWEAVLAGCAAGFAGVTLGLQARRRRPAPDAAALLWRLGMLSLLAAVALWAAGWAWPALRARADYGLALGVLYIAGFAMSVVNGMLYKIVPFLVWFHLARRRVPGVSNVREVLQDAPARRQAWLHAAAVGALLAAALAPGALTRPAGALLAVSALMLGWNLACAVRVYARHAGHPPRAPRNGATAQRP